MKIPLSRFKSLKSSSQHAIGLIKQGVQPAPFAILAESQSAGQGQHGKSWSSPIGNLYLSVALPVADFTDEELAAIPLRIALIVAKCLSDVTRVRVSLKWPNDIFVYGKKLAGILCQITSNSSGGSDLVVGIGVNVSSAPRLGTAAYSSICLKALSSKSTSVLALAEEVLASFSNFYLHRPSLASVIKEYSQFALAKGFVWTSANANTSEVFVYNGLDLKGQLRLKRLNTQELGTDEAGEVRVSSAGHRYQPLYFVSQTAPLCVFKASVVGIEMAAFCGLTACTAKVYKCISSAAIESELAAMISDFVCELDPMVRLNLSPIPIFYCPLTGDQEVSKQTQDKLRDSGFCPIPIRSRQIGVWSLGNSVVLPPYRLRRLEVLIAYSQDLFVHPQVQSQSQNKPGLSVVYSPEESCYDVMSCQGEFLGTFVLTSLSESLLGDLLHAPVASDLKPKFESLVDTSMLSATVWDMPWSHHYSWSARKHKSAHKVSFDPIQTDLKALALMSLS